MKEPLTVENSQTFSKCCFVCCCATEPLYLCSTIPVTGYTSGQTIHVAISADNKSAQEVDWFGVQMFQVTSEWWLSRFKQVYNGIWVFFLFWQHITYICTNTTKKKLEAVLICEKQVGKCHQRQRGEYCVDIKIPAVPPTDTETSKVCKVKYVLVVGFCFSVIYHPATPWILIWYNFKCVRFYA